MALKKINKDDLVEAVEYDYNEDERNYESPSCSNSGNGCTGSCNHSSK